MDEPKGFLRNSLVIAREGDAPLFFRRSDAVIAPLLDGYVIMPREQYERPIRALLARAWSWIRSYRR